MKRAAKLSTLLDRSTPWLSWWQELLLNWVASWASVASVTVCSATMDEYAAWDVPTDLELARMQLEELVR